MQMKVDYRKAKVKVKVNYDKEKKTLMLESRILTTLPEFADY